MINKGLFTSDKKDWGTPQKFFDELNKKYNFNLDVCASKDNAKCENYFTEEIDGLKQDWKGVCFMNPPYGRQISKWVEKAYQESLKGSTIVCLLPSRTDTRWFHDYCVKGEITFIKGRLKFDDGKNPAPFPSMIVVFK